MCVFVHFTRISIMKTHSNSFFPHLLRCCYYSLFVCLFRIGMKRIERNKQISVLYNVHLLLLLMMIFTKKTNNAAHTCATVYLFELFLAVRKKKQDGKPRTM